MSTFIISKRGMPVARLLFPAKSGACRYAFQRCSEEIDANREWNLVNASWGKISSAKKWQSWESDNGFDLSVAQEVNHGEFYITE